MHSQKFSSCDFLFVGISQTRCMQQKDWPSSFMERILIASKYKHQNTLHMFYDSVSVIQQKSVRFCMALSFFNEIQIQIIREQCVFILFKVGSFHIVLLYELLCKSLNLLYLYLLIRFHCEILLQINFFYDSRNPIKHLQVLS